MDNVINNKKLLRSRQSGLTLIELIVTIGILGIVLGSIYSFLLFGNRVFSKGTDKSDVQASLRLASDFIINELRNATEIRLSAPSNPNDFHQLYVSGNILKYKPIGGTAVDKTGAMILNPSEDLKFSLVQVGTKYTLKFEIKGTGQNNTDYFIESDVLLNNIKSAILTANSQVVYYKKSIPPPAAVPVNAQLDTLSLTFGALSPIFNSAHGTYVVRLPYYTPLPPEVNGIPKPDAQVTNTIQAAGIPGTARIFVSSLDGSSNYVYTISYERLPPPVPAVAESVTGNNNHFIVVFDKNIFSVTSKPAGTNTAQINANSVRIDTSSGNFANGNYSITVKDLDDMSTTVNLNKNGSNWTFP
jgi:prepilin-type N-terminal cleavage/methylation domain-containing protein